MLTSIKTKNRIYRKFLRTKYATTKQQLHSHFKYYRNNLTKITNARAKLFIIKSSLKIKVIYRKPGNALGEIINISKKKRNMMNNISSKNLVLDDPNHISKYFNQK